MPISVFHGVSITFPVILDLLFLVRPLVHRDLIHGLGLFKERRCTDLYRTREVVRLFAERRVRDNDRAQVRGRCGKGGRQGLEDGLNVLRELCGSGLNADRVGR